MAGKYAGRSGGRYRDLKRQVRATEDHCWHCGQFIDRSIPDRDEFGTVQLDAWTLAHKKPLARYPHLAEDPGNLAGAHRRCNLAAGDNEDQLGLGIRSRSW